MSLKQMQILDSTEAVKQERPAPCARHCEANAEREKVAAWMIQRGYATGHGDTVEDLLKELEWQIAENWTNALVNGVEGEREACAKVADYYSMHDQDTPADIAEAIRARGQA